MTDISAPVAIAGLSGEPLLFRAPAPMVAGLPPPKADEPAATATSAESNGTSDKAEDALKPAVAEYGAADGPAVQEDKVEKPLILAEPASAPAPVDGAATSAATNGDEPAVAAEESKGTEAKEASAEAPVPASATGNKRKAEEDEKGQDGVLPLTPASATEPSGESAAKKLKADKEAETATAEPVAAEPVPAAAESNGTTAKKNGSRAKREKKTLPPVGRTARKTRSQGPVDA